MNLREYRDALGHFATGVTVITVRTGEGNCIGITANSFNSVSLKPPLILWSLSKDSQGLKFFTNADYFCVNILAADQVEISDHFASPQFNKFKKIMYQDGAGGAPLLEGCAARFQCKTSFTYEGGDHEIIVGEVIAFDQTGKKSLVYHQGSYAISEPHPAFELIQHDNSDKISDFTDDYLDLLLFRTTYNFEQQFKKTLKKFNRTSDEWRLLNMLNEHEGCQISDLCNHVKIGNKRLHTIIKKLENDNLVTLRETGSVKQKLYCLTEKGRNETINLLAAAKAHETDALSGFNVDEARQFKYYLKRLSDQLDIP